MTSLIIPESFRPGSGHPLREFLDSANGRKFKLQVAMTAELGRAVGRVAQQHRMRNPDVLDALLTALVSVAQAIAPEDEWRDIASILADTIQSRMTVTGYNSHGE